MRLNVIVTHEPPWRVARCVEVDAVAQGGTAEEAVENLRDALALAQPTVTAGRERPVLTEIDVAARLADDAADVPGVDRAAFVRRAEGLGWRVDHRGRYDVLTAPEGDALVSLPLGAERVAPGVFRMVAWSVADTVPPRADAAELLGRLDALFARHPHDDDVTTVIREQRDAV